MLFSKLCKIAFYVILNSFISLVINGDFYQVSFIMNVLF